MTLQDSLTLVVLDGNAPWVRFLFDAMPSEVTIHWFRPTSLGAALRSPRVFLALRSWRSVGHRVSEKPFAFPGWTKFPRWSARVATAEIRRTLAMTRGPAVVVYTLPQYAPVAAQLTDVPSVYFAFDPYEHYEGWDSDAVRRGEDELFRSCRAAFAVSPALADDFRKRTAIPIFTQPNGIPDDALTPPAVRPVRPADMPARRPVALCVGQIGAAYDWQLLDKVTDRLPNIRFVFVGSVCRMPTNVEAVATQVLAKPNVSCLGWRDPAQLPGYLWNADVLFSPLNVTPANHRRSLLRMYDYLATDRPVLATPIDSSAAHLPFVRLAATPDQYVPMLEEAIRDGCPLTEVSDRRAYLAAHTWSRRAELFLTHLTAVLRGTD